MEDKTLELLSASVSGVGLSGANHDLAASGGFFNGLYDSLLKGVPGVATSAITSLINMPVDIVNLPYKFATGDNLIDWKLETQDVLSNLDTALGSNLESYYSQHRSGIDMGGFVASSLVPGTLGVKAVRAGIGTAAKMEGVVGKSFGFIDDLGKGTIEAAKMEMAKGSPFSLLSVDALKLYAAGAPAGIIDALAFNTAATLALHNSPYLEKKSAWDLTKDVVSDSLIFGGATGLFIDYAGKGVGVFGVRKVLGEYGEQTGKLRNIASDVNKTAVGEIGDAGVDITVQIGRTGKTGRPLKPKEVQLEIPEGDVATLWKLRAEQVKDLWLGLDEATKQPFLTKFGEGALDAKGLLSKVPELREAEIDTFVRAMDKSIRKMQVQSESSMRKVMEGITDVVDVNSLVKQFAKGSSEAVAQVFGGAKQITRVTQEALAEFAGTVTGKQQAFKALIDLENNTIVSNAKAVSIFDLPAVEAASQVAQSVKNTAPSLFREANPELTVLTGSARYKQAMDEFGNFTEEQAKAVLAKPSSPFVFARDLPKLEVLSSKISDNAAQIMVEGKPSTAAQFRAQLSNYKATIETDLANAGHSPDEISRMLSSSFDGSRQSLGKFVGIEEAQKTRYILAEYGKYMRSAVPDRFTVEATLGVEARNAAVRQFTDMTLAREFPSLMSGYLPRLPMEALGSKVGASGAFTFADADHGNLFQQTVNLLSKTYDNIMRKAAAGRDALVKNSGDVILAEGRASLAQAELMATNLWQQTARNAGNEIAVWRAADGNMYMFHKQLLDNTIEKLRASGEKVPVSDVVSQLIASNTVKGFGRDDAIIKITSPQVQNFYISHQNSARDALLKGNSLRNLRGQDSIADSLIDAESGLFKLYDPPPSKRNNPFTLVVKGDDLHQNPHYRGQTYVHVFPEEKALKTFRTHAEDLGLKTYTSQDTKDFFRAIDQYDAGVTFTGSAIKSDLQSKGRLVTALPGEETAEQIILRYREWHTRNELALTRDAIQLKHADELASLQQISYEAAATRDSRFSAGFGIKDRLAHDKPTEAEKLKNQLLNIQSQGRINDIIKTLDSAGNRFLAPLFTAIKNRKFKELDEGELLKLEHVYNKLGVEKSYSDAFYRAFNKKPGQDTAFDLSVRYSNLALVTGQLRLDALNQVVNIVGSPILGSSTVGLAVRSVKDKLAKLGDTEGLARLEEVFGTDSSGFGKGAYNFVKTAYKSVGRSDMLVKDSPVLAGKLGASYENMTVRQAFNEIGITTNASGAMMDNLRNDIISFVGQTVTKETPTKISSAITKTWDTILKPSDLVEAEVQWIAADAGLQIAEAARLPVNEAMALVNTIVQKLQGNYTASQKPQIFQGTVGAAIGLFQSYQARLVHRILDVVDSGDKRMLAEMAALQAGIFGIKSLPGVDYINRVLVAENNQDKQDIYSGMFDAFDRKIAATLMYGTASSLLGLNLSTRGAVDFRTPEGFQSIPAVSIWAKSVAGTMDFISQAAKGADLSVLANQALQHNVFSRPIQQLSTYAAGYRTSLDGKVAVDINDERFQHPDSWLNHNVTQAMRMLGGAPLDEAVYMDTIYRWHGYRMQDRESNKALGQVLSTKLLSGDPITEEDVAGFKESYLKNGGTQEGFKSWVKNQINNTSLDAGERLRKLVRNSEEAKQLQIMLGRATKFDSELNSESVSAGQ